MTVGELLDLLDGAPEDTTVRVVQQPSYPLVSDIAEDVHDGGIEIRDKVVFIHLEPAYDYYPDPDEEDEEDDDE
jgi:hypothetical protein